MPRNYPKRRRRQAGFRAKDAKIFNRGSGGSGGYSRIPIRSVRVIADQNPRRFDESFHWQDTAYTVSLRMEVTRYAYSTLPELLTRMRLTVTDVHKRLIKRGFRFDKKTLYRLASPAPLHRIDAPVMGAICAEFKVSLDDLLVWEPVKPKLHRIDAEMQERLDVLLEKNNEATITAAEKKELEELGETVERLSLENARMLARHSKQKRTGRTLSASAKRKAGKQS